MSDSQDFETVDEARQIIADLERQLKTVTEQRDHWRMENSNSSQTIADLENALLGKALNGRIE